MADIYGRNDAILKELGLASAEDEVDFKIKVTSLEDKWEQLAPGFYDWFSTRRAKDFIEHVICSAREGSGIEDLFYNNAIESMHAVLKRETSGKKLSVVDAIATIKRFIEKQESGEVRALYQTGKFRLSGDYKQFQVRLISLLQA